MPPPLIAAAAPIAGSLIGRALGPKHPQTTAQLPKDLQQSRQQTIDLMRYLLGFGGANPTQNANFGNQGAFGLTSAAQFGGGGHTESQGGLGGPSLQPFGQAQPGSAAAGGYGGFFAPHDTVPAMLRPGEYVLPPGMVQALGGPQQLERLRQHFAYGGPVLEERFGQGQAGMDQQPSFGGIPTSIGGFGAGPNTVPTRPMVNFGDGLPAPLVNPTGGGSPQQSRTESVFGPLGMPATGLQRQATGGITQFLNQPSPESRTLGLLSPGLAQLFGSGVQQATNAPGGTQSSNLLPPEVMAALTRIGTGQSGFSGIGSFGGGGGGGLGMEGTEALRRIMSQAPGQGVIEALQPFFDRNLALANQAGGRFGTANAVTRSRALDDFNLMAAQAAQQGVNQQLDAAQRLASLGIQQGQGQAGLSAAGQQQQLAAINALLNAGQASQSLGQQGALGAGSLLGQLAGQSGGSDFGRLLQGYGVGAQQAQQNDVGTQRNLAILLQQLGGLQQATLGAPVQTSPTGAQQGAGLGGMVGSILALLPYLNQGGGNQQDIYAGQAAGGAGQGGT